MKCLVLTSSVLVQTLLTLEERRQVSGKYLVCAINYTSVTLVSRRYERSMHGTPSLYPVTFFCSKGKQSSVFRAQSIAKHSSAVTLLTHRRKKAVH